MLTIKTKRCKDIQKTGKQERNKKLVLKTLYSPCYCGTGCPRSGWPHGPATSCAVSACWTPEAHPCPFSPGMLVVAKGSPDGLSTQQVSHGPESQS